MVPVEEEEYDIDEAELRQRRPELMTWGRRRMRSQKKTAMTILMAAAATEMKNRDFVGTEASFELVQFPSGQVPLSSTLHGAAPATLQHDFPSFEPYPFDHQTTLYEHVEAHQQQALHQHPQLHHHHLPFFSKEQSSSCSSGLISAPVVLESDRSIPEAADPWSDDEVHALLRIKSSMENWFPEFTWEHVSRTLAEVGFKRSAEKCKEKFEESMHSNTLNDNKSHSFFSDLDDIYHPEMEKRSDEKKEEHTVLNIEEDNEVKKPADNMSKKRKRKHKFEMVKGFCEATVKKIMIRQEEMHNKLMEEILKRDEEMIAREVARKHEEMARLNKELDLRAKEQSLANDRQALLIDLLKNFSSGTSENHQILANKIEDYLKMSNSIASEQEVLMKRSLSDQAQTVYPSFFRIEMNTINVPSLSTQNCYSSKMHESHPLPRTPFSSFKGSNERDDVGTKWPRDEVLALVNLRCSLISTSSSSSNNSSCDDNNRDGSSKGSVWERISQGMHQLGYTRSAKKCKEKWENINKYFRKTKDNKKNRSLDSRTCPYYHQLCSLYSEGVLAAPIDPPALEKCPT